MAAEPGEHWAYRARGVDPLVEVTVVRFGTQKPPRVLVSFVDASFEGREEWVPPARLKVPWSEAKELEAMEARWDAVDTNPGFNETPTAYAIETVFEAVIDSTVAEPVYRYAGVTSIADPSALARRLTIDEALLRSDPLAFEDDGALIVPWAITEQLVRRACELYPDEILQSLVKEEAEALRESTHGYMVHFGRGDAGRFVEPEDAAARDAEWPFAKRKRDLVRTWCGAEAVDRMEELAALRKEVVRVDELLSEAIRALQDAGQKAKADDLTRRFGVPLSEAKSHRW
ncbi:hypothetical protein ET445_13860 [Agromyces protaetiae]|uniref:PE-PGRS family protein n=1 Tax=Agromyces protaetiae TaxID=2509455 RepID=A0A4P6FUJ9_9MICO|nr:hypothetical protein [Agromyces protaetiae]QAY74248.1 hypothetical protein ET445_13860 [Agromyces protaetiae]